jgi:hypothetical protein
MKPLLTDIGAAVCAALLLCGSAVAQPGEGVALTPEKMAKLGLVTQVERSAENRAQVAGFGAVMPHETFGQAAAEIATARAAARQSRATLARQKTLAGTPGAVSGEVEDSAIRQAAVDEAALDLAYQRLTSTLGTNPPWKSGDDRTLKELASGRVKLLRATFPLGALNNGTPASLRAARIGAAPSAGWMLRSVWNAPADANVPGRSFFALLKEGDAAEGERLEVWAPTGPATAGVLIADSAVVMSEGKYWCYVEKKPGTFMRVEIDAGRPTTGGYFVTDSVHEGDKVVTTGAAFLLAAESNSGAEPD